MPQTIEQLKAAAALAQAQLDAAQKAADAEAAAVANPRPPATILVDLLTMIGMHQGNRPQFRALIAEYKAAAGIEPAPATDPAAPKVS